jgi:magnesium-transporting ATPase (P-type)
MVLVALIIMLVVKMTGPVPWYKALLKHSLEYANMIVVLFVVVVPEGLPLTIGVSLAYTTGRMYSQDGILVKKT